MLSGTIKLNRVGLAVVLGLVGIVILYYLGFLGGGDPPSNRRTVSVKTLLIESVIAAEKGGIQVKSVHDSKELNSKSKGKTKEGADSPVTDADLNSHSAITTSLRQALGGDAIRIISEEHTHSNKMLPEENTKLEPSIGTADLQKLPDDVMVNLEDIVIWIDPLDATQEFTENLLEYVTVMVCVAVKGKPLIGVIHSPFQLKTVWGWVGQAKSLNLVPSADASNSEQNMKVVVSRSHSGEVKEIAKKAFGEKTQVIPAGGAGFKVLQIVTGKADAYLHTTVIKKWDVCAGNAVLEAVGGKMTSLTGDNISYESRDGDVIEDGLLATLHNHEKYLVRF